MFAIRVIVFFFPLFVRRFNLIIYSVSCYCCLRQEGAGRRRHICLPVVDSIAPIPGKAVVLLDSRAPLRVNDPLNRNANKRLCLPLSFGLLNTDFPAHIMIMASVSFLPNAGIPSDAMITHSVGVIKGSVCVMVQFLLGFYGCFMRVFTRMSHAL